MQGIVPGDIGAGVRAPPVPWASASMEALAPTEAQATMVDRNSRLLVRGAGRADVDGVYVARWTTATQWSSTQGETDHVTLQFFKERGVQYIMSYAKKVGKKLAYWRISGESVRLYECEATSLSEVPVRWKVAVSQISASLGPAPMVVDVSGFGRLTAEFGFCKALLTEVGGFISEEARANLAVQPKHNSEKMPSGKVYATPSDGPECHENDNEHFEPGNIVKFTQDEAFLRKELEEVELRWDSIYYDMLGGSHQVLDVPSPDVVTLLGPQGERVKTPVDAVDMDYSNIAQFDTHSPIFIILQTAMCVILWGYFASRDAGRNGASWAQTMGGLESVWPGHTSLLTSKDCEDYRFQIWRWFSYQFSHVGLAHIGTNAVTNLILGWQLEKFHGTVKMLAMYQLGVFGGACCYMVSDAHRPVVGTSGGCFALIGIRMGDLIMNWSERPWRFTRLFFLSSLILILFLMEATNKPEGGASTSNAAHVGGGIAGLMAGVWLGRNLVRSRCEVVFMILIFLLGIFLVSLSFGVGLQWPPKNLFEDEPWCWMRLVSNATLTGTWDWTCIRCHSADCMQKWSMGRRISTVTADYCLAGGGFWYTER